MTVRVADRIGVGVPVGEGDGRGLSVGVGLPALVGVTVGRADYWPAGGPS